jgi:hypothetical protein
MAVCNRPDRNEDWEPWWTTGEQKLGGRGDTFLVWCNRHLDRELPGRCRNWGEDLNRVYPKLLAKGVWNDVNFEENSWTRGSPWGGVGCNSGSIGWCTMKTPKEANKYACCTNGKTSVLQCGQNWCKEDRSNCDTFMSTYCSAGTRLIDDANCYSKFQISKITEINQMCSEPANIMKPSCRDFCNNQIATDGGFTGTCQASAGSYCAAAANASKPECTCINYSKSPEYKAFISKLPNGEAGIPNPQCWANVCTTGNPLTSFSKCPTNMALCIQGLTATDITSQNIGKVGSDCNIQLQTSSTTTPPAVPGSSSPPPPRTPPPSSSLPPPPGSSTPPGVSVSQSPSPPPSAGETLSPGAIAGIVIVVVIAMLYFAYGSRSQPQIIYSR